MKDSDVNAAAVRRCLAKMPQSFRTKDLSELAELVAEHGLAEASRFYNAAIGRHLSKNAVALGIRKHPEHPGGANQLWERLDGARAAPSTAAAPQLRQPAAAKPAAAGPLVRRGHYLALDYMASPAFEEIRALLEAEPDIGGVYFRPTDRGLTMVDLHPDSPRPRIGIGEDPILRTGSTAGELAASLPARIAYLREVRASQAAPAEENQLEARIIRAAQAGQLRMPGFPERLRFVHSQWRIHLAGGQRFTDLIAVDLQRRELRIIELKRAPDPTALAQVAEYVRYFEANAIELLPFFLRLSIIMGARYDCPELAKTSELSVASAGVVAWPRGNGALEVRGIDG